MNIDWSKAPEGATHFGPKHSYLIERWFRKAGAGWDLWEGGEWGPCCGGIQKLREDTLIKIPAKITPWTGEGLPPAGVECEFSLNRGKVDWATGKVIGQDGPHQVVIKYGLCEYHARNIHGVRPIRTPEQIAAEEREKTIAELKKVFDSISHELCQTSNKYLETLFGAIHDAGWKQVKP